MMFSSRIAVLSLVLFCLGACAPVKQTHNHVHEPLPAAGPEKVTIEQVKNRLGEKQPIVFLDSRNEVEWGLAQSMIPGALRVGNNEQLARLVKHLDKGEFIVTYCT